MRETGSDRGEVLLCKFLLWCLVMLVCFEVGLQIGLAKGRRLGTVDVQTSAAEGYGDVDTVRPVRDTLLQAAR